MLPAKLSQDEQLVWSAVRDIEAGDAHALTLRASALRAGLDDRATVATIQHALLWPGARPVGRVRVTRAAGRLCQRGLLRRRRPRGLPFVYEVQRFELTDEERG
jgi:hypothetical protein